jgi:hypothetical protein
MNQKNNLIYIILVLLNLNFISSQLLNNNELQISNCFTASEVSGCLNVDCQKKVCKIDNYCCIMNWDQLCVRNANYYCNKANKNLTRNDLTPIMNEIIYNNSLNNLLNETELNNNETELNNNETELNNNETELNNNETELNNLLNETELNNNETELNNNETELNNNENELNETKLNETELNNNENQLDEKNNKNIKSLSSKLNINIYLLLLVVFSSLII